LGKQNGYITTIFAKVSFFWRKENRGFTETSIFFPLSKLFSKNRRIWQFHSTFFCPMAKIENPYHYGTRHCRAKINTVNALFEFQTQKKNGDRAKALLYSVSWETEKN